MQRAWIIALVLSCAALIAAAIPLAGAVAGASPAAPSNLRLTGEADALAWDDNSPDEAGFRIAATNSATNAAQTYDIPANVTTLSLPAAARTSCADRRPSMQYSIIAWNFAGSSDPAITSIHSGCGSQSTSSTPLGVPDTEPFALSVTFREDADSDGKLSAGDAVPATVGISLVPWSTVIEGEPNPEVILLSDQSGVATFANLPPDSYSLRIYWPGGFPLGGAANDVPFILQAAFTVTADGDIVPPASFPKTWPGSLVPFDPAAQNAILGRIPSPLLLGRKDPNVVSITTDIGWSGPPATGIVDVTRALLAVGRPAALPGAGSAAASGSRIATFAGLGMLAGIGLIVVLAALYKRRQDAR